MSASPELPRTPPDLVLSPLVVARSPVDLSHPKNVDEKEEQQEGCRTPTSEDSRIPAVPHACPPAPKKLRPSRVILCKRRLSELDLFIVPPEDLDAFFLPCAKKQKWARSNDK